MTKIELMKKYGGPWHQNYDFPREDWQYEVANFNTNHGYWEFVASKMGIELEEDKAVIVRRACIKAHNLDLDQFEELFNCNGCYAKEKWRMMGRDFSKWFCQLDSENAKKFCRGL